MIRQGLLGLMLMPGLAQAHAVISPQQAESGQYFKGVMTIGHGCDGSATTKVTITIPPGFRGAKPMPKAGWQIDVVKYPLAMPYESHGKTVTNDVHKITWYGNELKDEHFDEFEFIGLVAVGATSKLYFPVHQQCVLGELQWNQTPEQQPESEKHKNAKLQSSTLNYPAPLVTVIDGQGHHHH
ncbi:nuclear export factor GLE1 [Methylophaga frappieri]|uniref:Nuclear export factor GLE1 n=1 Tax=Methylophaga frappieri (strain ATCC BAA-2434 / DSM 25690 / JAM7) TaxID=754477 RepID=I1YH82_METFJ|nr:YcnI family protein [Methylophaga frappieri]AFJ02275.1 nuclear export factor GLE1 [Methylophaga frappieri]